MMPLTAIAPLGDRIVTGSLKLIFPKFTIPVPSLRPMVILLNPSDKLAISAAERLKVSVSPPMSMVVLGLSGCKMRLPGLVRKFFREIVSPVKVILFPALISPVLEISPLLAVAVKLPPLVIELLRVILFPIKLISDSALISPLLEIFPLAVAVKLPPLVIELFSAIA